MKLHPFSTEHDLIERIQKLYHEENLKQQGRGILNSRETEIMQELIKGRSNKEIARSLSISENTVKFHLKHIYALFGVHTRREAVIEAEKRQLLAP